MIFFKNRLEFWGFMLFAIPTAFKACDTEADAQGFRPAPAKPGAPTPPVFVPRKGVPKLVKSIEVKQECPPIEQGSVAGIDRIDTFSNGLMKVHCYIFNKGKSPIGVFPNHKETRLSDANGETYEVVAREALPDRGGYSRDILPGTKIRWWYAFNTPAVTTEELLVNLRMVGSYTVNEGLFPPFEIDLWPPNHLGPDPTPMPEIEPEPIREPQPPAPQPPPIGKPVPQLPPNPVILPPVPAPILPEPKQPPVIYEGNASLKAGVAGMVRISFESAPEPGDTDIRARMHSQNLKPLRTSLTGRAVDDPAQRSGISYVLTTDSGTVLRLAIDGKLMTGTDSNDGRYSLRLVEPPKRPASPSRVITRK